MQVGYRHALHSLIGRSGVQNSCRLHAHTHASVSAMTSRSSDVDTCSTERMLELPARVVQHASRLYTCGTQCWLRSSNPLAIQMPDTGLASADVHAILEA